MTNGITFGAIGQLRAALMKFNKSAIYRQIVEPRDQILARFQPIFSLDHVATIGEDEFKSFLLLENNRHWSGLHRQGSRMCSDMAKLRRGLSTLLAEDQPLAQRLDSAIGDIYGMGKNVASAILLVAHPVKYGVWNNRSEAQMKRLGAWPDFERGDSFGKRYVKVNQVLLQIRDELETDLWTLDALWWFLDQNESNASDEEAVEILELADKVSAATANTNQHFGLERHLHQFLLDNWNHIELSKDWAIYSEPGDEEAGYEYQAAMAASGAYGKTLVAHGIVGHVNLTLGDGAKAVLEAEIAAGNGRFRGIRHSSPWDADKNVAGIYADRPKGLLLDPTFRKGFSCLAPLGLSYDGWLFFTQLDEFADLARAFPDTKICLDHCGGIIGIGSYAGRREEIFKTWKASIREVAECPNVVVKLGGLAMVLPGFGFHERPKPPNSAQAAAAWKPYIETCIEAFGVDRCMFESNFPPDKGQCSYQVIFNAFKRLAANFSESEKTALFSKTATDFYRLQLPAHQGAMIDEGAYS